MCAGGGQTPLLPINSIQSSFLSLWFSLGFWDVCLAFPKTGCSLGVNQRDTHRPERPWIYLYVCLHAFLQSVYVCSFVSLWKTKCFFFMFLCYGLQYLSCENIWNHFLLTDWPTNRRTIWQPIIPPEMSPAFAVKQHVRVFISLWDQRLPMGLA